MGYRIVTMPTDEPLTLAQVHAHLRLSLDGAGEHPDDDMLTGIYLPAARSAIENYTNRSLAPQTIELRLDGFPAGGGAIRLPRPTVTAVLAVTYVDAAGVLQTLNSASYGIDVYNQPNWLVSATEAAVWPVTAKVANAVRVTYTAGDAATVDPILKSSILLTLAHLYINRQDVSDRRTWHLPQGALDLATPHIVEYAL